MPAMPRVGVVPYDRTRAILDGTVGADAGFAFEAASVMDITMALLDGGSLDGRFDAGEMSLATFAKAVDEGLPLRAIPVFTNRKFFQQYIYVRPNAGIRSLADLRGRRVGGDHVLDDVIRVAPAVAGIRGRRVAAGDVSWTHADAGAHGIDGGAGGGRDSVSGEEQPAGPAEPGPGRHGGLRAGGGHLAGHPGRGATRSRDPSRTSARSSATTSHGRRSFPSCTCWSAGRSCCSETQAPADRLAKAFAEAKQAAYDWMQDEARTALPLVRGYLEETAEIFGPDPFQDGLEPNRLVLETFLTAAAAQGLTTRRLAPEDLFA